jgi:hypothetical protein
LFTSDSYNFDAATTKTKAEPSKDHCETAHNLSGHVYYFGFCVTNCKLLPECDCCTDDFFSEWRFYKNSILYGWERIRYKGHAVEKKSNLILKYDYCLSILSLTNYETKMVSNDNKKNWLRSKTDIVYLDTIFSVPLQWKKVFIKLSEISFGTISDKDSIQTYIEELKDGFWKNLWRKLTVLILCPVMNYL